MMRFYFLIAQGAGGKGKAFGAFFFGWFAVISTMIAAVFTSLVLKSPLPESAAATGGYLLTAVIAFFMTALSLVFWLIVFTIYFGKGVSSRDNKNLPVSFPVGEVLETRLWGCQIACRVHGGWTEVRLQLPPATPQDMAWSWIAFDHHKNDNTKSTSDDILEAAIWSLAAQGYAVLKTRPERHSLLGGLWKGREVTDIYVFPTAKEGRATGSWEDRILQKLRDPDAEQVPVPLLELLITVFGDSTSSPHSHVSEVVQLDFIGNGWGFKSGKMLPKFEYAEDMGRIAENTRRWQDLRAYIEKHQGVAGMVREKIEKMLKDRVDVS